MTVRRLAWFLVLTPVVVVAVMSYDARWTHDDAYVYFRVVDQILGGNGPVWNAGVRVETTANPLWLGVLTVGDVISPFRLEYTAAALGWVASIVALVLATISSIMLGRSGGRSAVHLPLGLAVFAALWPVWVWSTGGLGTGLTLCWLGACCLILARWATGGRSVSRAGLVVLGLGWTLGVDSVLFSLVFVATVVFGAASPGRQRWRMVAWAAALPVVLQVFRMGYYGMVLPMVSVQREDTTPRPGFGWDYLRDFISPYVLAIPLVTIALAGYAPLVRLLMATRARRQALVVLALAGCGVAHATVLVVIMGGDAVHARMLLPSLFVVLAPVFVISATRPYVPALVVCAIWAVLCGTLLRPEDQASSQFSTGYPGPRLTVDDAGYSQRGVQEWMDGPGFYIADPYTSTGARASFDLADPDRVVVASPGVDALSYALGPDIDVLDVTGTGEPLTSHHALGFRLRPGAEKAVFAPWVAAIFAERPMSVLPGELPFDRPFQDPIAALDHFEQVAWAEATLDCERIDRLVAASEESLTVDRFLGNVWHAMSNTTLRFGSAPERAFVDARCGSEVPAGVVDFWSQVDTDGTVMLDASRGTVATAGRCDVTLVATGRDDRPWIATDARGRTAFVELDPEASEPAFAAVFVIGSGSATSAVVWVSTDGDGNVQVVQDVNWIPSIASPWEPIAADQPLEIAIVPDNEAMSWVTLVDGQVLASAPMIEPSRSRLDKDLVGAPPDGEAVVSTPFTAAPGSTEPEIRHERYSVSSVCQAIAAHHPTPSSTDAGRIDRVVPSAT